MDIIVGPPGKGGFAPGETVTCDLRQTQDQRSQLEFECAVAPGDEVKVKYGSENGEPYGEVAATRLLWALGFGADRMYPVHVICSGVPDRISKVRRGARPTRFSSTSRQSNAKRPVRN